MRLLFITKDFAPETGGIQNYMMEYARRFSKKCEDLAVICPQKPGSKDIDSTLGFPVYRIPVADNSLLNITLYKQLGSIVQKHKPDATFHAQFHTCLAAARQKEKGALKKIFCAVHGRELHFNPYKRIPVLSNVFSKFRSKSLTAADHFFPVSRYTQHMLLKAGVPSEKVTVHGNGTDIAAFFPENQDALKRNMGLSEKKILLTVARAVPRKGIDSVIDALPLILKKHPDLHYIIIGDGPALPQLKKQTNALGLSENVSFMGNIPDNELRAYYNLCDIFVMVPRSGKNDVEGFGIVYQEANACAKPVIGSKSGGIPDSVIHKQTGLLVKENHPKKLAKALHKLLKNETYAKQLGLQGLERVRTETNWDLLADTLYHKMDALLSDTSRM